MKNYLAIIWHLLWFIPAHLARWTYVAVIFLGWGVDSTEEAIYQTS